MIVEIIDVTVESKGKYRVANVNYKSEAGRVDGKKIMSFTFKDVFKTLSEAKQGDKFDVKAVKNDNGYWDWTEAVPAGKNTGATGVAEGRSQATRSNFETPEERAKRQVYIVRQSSIASAIALLNLTETDRDYDAHDVIELARQFEGYVFDVPAGVAPAEVS